MKANFIWNHCNGAKRLHHGIVLHSEQSRAKRVFIARKQEGRRWNITKMRHQVWEQFWLHQPNRIFAEGDQIPRVWNEEFWSDLRVIRDQERGILAKLTQQCSWLKLDFTKKYTDGLRTKSRNLTKVLSSNESLSEPVIVQQTEKQRFKQIFHS